ncbi:hypothetical protein FACS189485_15770 [Spirochaetia bacterium]|nr:hypothetical protein FACS189485_15770 [Spirochaetia bacterium]
MNGTILNDFWIRFTPHALQKQAFLSDRCINTIYVLSSTKYLLIGKYLYFCDKIK